MKTQAFVYSTTCALLLAACSNGGDPKVSPGKGVCGPFTSELRVEDKFGQQSATFTTGEPIEFKMRITNTGDSKATLSYDGCPSIRFVVSDAQRQIVFDSLPPTTPCTQPLRLIEYQPKETMEFGFEWDQTRSSDGSQVPPGPYTANARDRSIECNGALDRTADFTIQ
ncbi:MAG: hypothetical protein KGJ55_06670 [Gammaproteobacteria bacterium]|nr:hypothetical protein [Gammaproteobacteria bacterium]